MQCPKCESPFEAVVYEGIEVDRCAGCGGIWFDAGEKERLQRMKGAAQIDTAHGRTAGPSRKEGTFECPRCGVGMFRMVDATQFHIEFESCPTCYGSFFDAGEFRDLTELTLLERLRKAIDLSLLIR